MVIIKKFKIAIILVAMLMVAVLVPVITYSIDTIEKINMILPQNVYVDGINIGGKELSEGLKYLRSKEEEILNRKITISSKYDGGILREEFTLQELGYKSNLTELEKDIVGLIHNDLKLIDKFKRYRNIEETGVEYNITYTIDYEEFMKAMSIFDDALLKKPVDAQLKFEDGKFTIIPGENGYVFNKEKLYDELKDEIGNLEEREVTLELKSVEPEITAKDIEGWGIREKVASFTTKFDASNKERVENIKLSSQSLKGKIIAPNEIFSFNETVGKRTVERGYKEAGVYIKGKLSTDIGGGICQVSSTLYNTVLLHDLEILERSNHSLTVSYVPLSRDATVDWGNKDFKFRNNTDYYIYIDTIVGTNTITIDLYSTKSDKTVVLVSETLEVNEPKVEYIEDPTLPPGTEVVEEKGQTGYTSRLIKKIYKDGKLIETKQVSKDRYLSIPKVIKRNSQLPKVNKEPEAPVIDRIETGGGEMQEDIEDDVADEIIDSI